MEKSLVSLRFLLVIVLLAVGSTAYAAGPAGVNVGWVINSNGTPILTSSFCTQLSAANVGQVRVGFHLVNGKTTWDSAMLGYYDTVVNNCKNAGISMIGLIEQGAWPGTQADWCANNFENTGGNGSNTWISGYSNNACVTIISHFRDRIKYWEILNEPNAWTSNPQPGVFTGGSFLYPSNYSQVLANTWANVKQYGGMSDVTLVFGGVLGHSNGGVFTYTNAGAQYIDDTYDMGINHVGSFAYTMSHWGVYPVDGIGQHFYIDQGGTTTNAHVQSYLDYCHQAMTKYEGGSSTKKTFVTEFGWPTSSVTQAQQQYDLVCAFNVMQATSYVKQIYWFEWQDNLAANPPLYFGVIDWYGVNKIAYGDLVAQECYQGKTSQQSGTNTNVTNYYSARGQAQLGNPYDNGGGPWVHTWGSANVQDCEGGSHGRLTIFDSTSGTFEVNDLHGFCSFYLANGGISYFGPPTNNEYTYSGGYRQDFSTGHYLTWTSAGGVVKH